MFRYFSLDNYPNELFLSFQKILNLASDIVSLSVQGTWSGAVSDSMSSHNNAPVGVGVPYLVASLSCGHTA